MLEHTGREAKRLGLGVDMATGTGWPFGGPLVPIEDANSGDRAGRRQAYRRTHQDDGEARRAGGRRTGARSVFGGGDHALPRAVHPGIRPASPADSSAGSFTTRSSTTARDGRRHCRTLFAADAWLRHPDVRPPSFSASNRPTPIPSARVKSDYRETLARLHLEYLDTWVQWSHAHGFIARNQSHGAPANLLDLYGDVDVPETELFGSTPFPIPGLRRLDDEVRHDQDLPDSLVIRMASSAAHVMGRRLTSSESSTWLRDNWKVALSYAKPELDRVMLDGINHVFYHGTVYSPQDAPWPGWLFYASTQYNPDQSVVGRLRRDEPLCRARPVGSPERQPRQRHPACTGRYSTSGTAPTE